MHYTRMFSPDTLRHCDSPASAKIIVDYVKIQLHFGWGIQLTVDADPVMEADGLPDYLTFIRWIADSIGFASESGFITHDFVENAVNEITLMCSEVHCRHWNAAFHEGATRSREDRELDNATEQLRAMFYQSADASDIV